MINQNQLIKVSFSPLQLSIFSIFNSLLFMLPNSSQFLCASGGILTTLNHPFALNSSPYNIVRRSPTSFLLCDNNPQENKVSILDMDIQGEKTLHLDFDNFAATRWDSFDDYLLMINSDGDIVYINLNNKSIDMVKKQHPGESVCVLHSENDFITAGGYVKSLDKDQSERIIKIWGIDNEDKLICKSRFSTGHTKPVESALMMNRNQIATLSKDRTIRFSDINFQATVRTIYTPAQQPLSACQLDYHTMMYGGNRPYLNMVDIRSRKDIRERIALNEPLTQVTKIVRFSESELMLCNVNNLMILDLNTLKIRQKKQVEGETIWALKVLSQNHFVIGNRGKFVQVWKVLEQ